MAENKSYTLLFTDSLLEQLEAFYAGLTGDNPSPYMVTFVRGKGFTIAAYSKQIGEYFRVLFQGAECKEEAELWLSKGAIYDPKRSEGELKAKANPKPAPKKKAPSSASDSYYPQIGSDEVGTGDYFGPIIVVAAYVTAKDLPRLKELGVTDSKKMSDEHILAIGPTLVKEFKYSQLCLDNRKYNEVYRSGLNMNAMKAKMHNRALSNLASLYPSAYRYQDQFAAENLYYSYLKEEKEVLRGIIFSTKGELSYPSVALASVIARYSFLKHMEELSKGLACPLPFGAGSDVDRYAINYLKSHTLEELDSISKANFANRKKILGEQGS